MHAGVCSNSPAERSAGREGSGEREKVERETQMVFRPGCGSHEAEKKEHAVLAKCQKNGNIFLRH